MREHNIGLSKITKTNLSRWFSLKPAAHMGKGEEGGDDAPP